jgi:lpxtg cell wall surface protein, collagen binding domain protein
MKTNKLTLLTVATIATATIGIKGVNADESDRGITPETTTITTNQGGETSGTESTIPATEAAQPADSNNDAGTGSVEVKNNEREGLPTTFKKDGDQIRVENPEVVVDQSNGNGKYQSFTVEYKDVHFPDDLEINEGDKVTFKLPEEINFQTNYEFDVKNPENAVVGKASTDVTTQTVTTVFNNYFKDHPLNKQMSLKLDAKWTDKVESGKPVTVNFNGTLVTANIGKEQVIGKDELIAKWGSQDENDPSVINWTIRLNYARKVLNYVKIIDEMSENQKLVDDYFEIKNIESLDPWIEKGSAMDLVKSISKSDHGFTITMDRLDHMIYLNYKTKLTSAVKDSVNPTNKVELKAEDSGAVSYSYVQLVGGRGDASGENKPVWEIPGEAPKYELPEWQGGTTPFDAPILEKPEWHGGTVPFDAPVLDKPEKIIEIPEPKQDEPKEEPKQDPKPKQDKPNTPAPKTKEEPKESPKEAPKVEGVKIVKEKEESEKPIKAYSAPAMLPNTGTEFGIAISLLGLAGLSLGMVALKKKEN